MSRHLCKSHSTGMPPLAGPPRRPYRSVVRGTRLYKALDLHWLTAIVTVALVVTPPSEICKDTASPVGVPDGTDTLI